MFTCKRRTFFAALAGVFLLATANGTTARADIESEANTFLSKMGTRAISELADTSASETERVQRFRTLLVENIDLRLVAQQVLARYWRAASEQERSEFTIALREGLIVRFLPIFDAYKGETFDVVSTRTSTKNPNVVGAVTNIQTPGGDTARIEWFMRRVGDGLLIYDFSAEGIRLTTSLQEEFGAVLRDNGGSVADLTRRIEAKLPSSAVLQ